MSSALLPHVPLGRLFGLIEAMAETPGPDDLYRLAARLRLRLDALHPLVEAARLLGWATVATGDYDLTAEGRRVAEAGVPERKALFRERVRRLPLISSVLRALSAGSPVPREVIVGELRAHVPPPEAERQVDTAINWGRWADLFDYDADDACFLPAGEAGP
ncbi:MAG TPA: AAA-associated domain-containing protein [Vicinamibacteria bacterium]|nr:AAA-associated domain-containing protein [Vicinamibacteria bacterium]